MIKIGDATFAWRNRIGTPEFWGSCAVARGRVTFSNSYAADGDAIDWSAVSAIRDVKEVLIKGTDGETYLFVADLVNNKILAYTALGTQVTATTDLDAVSVPVLIMGDI